MPGWRGAHPPAAALRDTRAQKCENTSSLSMPVPVAESEVTAEDVWYNALHGDVEEVEKALAYP